MSGRTASRRRYTVSPSEAGCSEPVIAALESAKVIA